MTITDKNASTLWSGTVFQNDTKGGIILDPLFLTVVYDCSSNTRDKLEFYSLLSKNIRSEGNISTYLYKGNLIARKLGFISASSR